MCTLGEVPSQDTYNTDIITFDATTGQLSIATSSSSTYAYTSMDFVLTCTSTESIHMEPLRTVTDTFSVNFVSASTVDCANDYGAYIYGYTPIPAQQTYQIDGGNAEMYITPSFFTIN